MANEGVLIADDLLQARAADNNQIPLLCFPKTERGITDHKKFTGKEIDRKVDHAAKYFVQAGLQPKGNNQESPAVIALLGPTNLAYIITFFALARLGYTSLCLSPRLAANACAKLIEETGAIAVIPGKAATNVSLLSETQKLLPNAVQELRMVGEEELDNPNFEGPRFQRENVDRVAESQWILAILHSSGSTGLPKPLFLPHKRMMTKIPPPKGQTEFNTFPFFHGYGSWAVLHALMDRKTMYMYNPNLPITAEYCIQVLEHVRPDVLHAVPYTMGLLALSKRGVDAMAKCQRVVFSGTACPDDLGNNLVAKGVNVEAFWGATEMGGLGSSFDRPVGDDTWDYIRISPALKEFIWMKPLGEDTYECVFLHGLPALIVSNSDDPPKSFHSKDIFLKHPKMEAWKHIGRLDDRLTLINGEKILPVPIEARIRLDALVRECCVFGNGKSIPGILIFLNEDSESMSDDEFIDAIWPTIERANANAETFSRLSRETVVPLSAKVDYPKTDKESIKRAQMYRVFAREIDEMYEKLEYAGTGTLKLGLPDLEKWLMGAFHKTTGVRLSSVNEDFFAAGINSLQAIQMRGLILKIIDLGGNSKSLTQNVIFKTANVACLAKHLYALRLCEGDVEFDEDEVKEMNAMIKKYSDFTKHMPSLGLSPNGQIFVLTGATGSLGAHVLAQLLCRSDVLHVFCLVRGKEQEPRQRILSALEQRNLPLGDLSLLTALESDLGKPFLGLSVETYKELELKTTTIIHSAWAVNFNIGFHNFEDPYISGVHNLIQFSLCNRTPQPARLFFCSSVAVALASPTLATVPELPLEDLTKSLPQGYARSKLVSEHIVHNAAKEAGALTRTLRIGQIVGDSKMGLWNDTEAIPLIIRSALTLKILPALDETQSWLPVDILAATVLDLVGVGAGQPPAADHNTDLIYNIQNPNRFSWEHVLLPTLAKAGLAFKIVPVNEWIQRLREYQERGGDPERNPAVKLIDHFERTYTESEEKRGQVEFELKTALAHSKTLRDAPALVKEGYIDKFVKAWLEKWKEGKGNEVESSG